MKRGVSPSESESPVFELEEEIGGEMNPDFDIWERSQPLMLWFGGYHVLGG